MFKESKIVGLNMVFLLLLSVAGTLPLQSQQYAIPQLFKGDSILHDQYGITSHITWHGFEYDNYQYNIDVIKKSGNNIIRTDFSARNLGWYTGNANYQIWDNVNNEATSQGLRLLPIIIHSPQIPTTGFQESNNGYLKSCVTRYGNNVVGWEIGNELDLANVQDGSFPPSEYLSLLKETYTIIKSLKPNNTVLLGAIGDLNNHYLEDLLSQKAANFFDILSIHYYSGHSIPEAIIPFYKKLDSLMVFYQVDKPVWLTETGYNTYTGDAEQEVFYSEILPKVYKRIGIDISNYSLGLLYDSRIQSKIRNQDNKAIYSGFKSCNLVTLEELKGLSVKKCPILMILFREFFPKGYFEDLLSYVKRGGTVVFPEGGAALFNELDLETHEISDVGKKCYKPLHINYIFPWNNEAKEKGIKRIKSIKTTPEIGVQYSWHEEDVSNPMFLGKENLKDGDEMIPLIYGSDNKNTNVVAACFHLNSELTGNVIIQSRHNHSIRVSENMQSTRLPRIFLLSYAYGIDKVLLYCLRDVNYDGGYGIVRKNNEKKKAFETLKTLTHFLPSGSSRPQIKEVDNQYIASWVTPSGRKVYCVWTSWVGKNTKVKIKGKPCYFSSTGKRIKKMDFSITPEVTYITGASSLDFE